MNGTTHTFVGTTISYIFSGGSEILVYSHGDDGVTVQSGTIPYTIKRIFASGPQMWNIVTKDNENLLLKLEDGKWMMEAISHDCKTGLDTVGAQFHGNKTTLISEPYYFVKGDCTNKVEWQKPNSMKSNLNFWSQVSFLEFLDQN